MSRELKNQINDQSAFSLVEVLVSTMIIAVLTLGIYSLLLLSLKITADNKFYVEAISLANQKMEQIRNLPYEDVGTISGSPSGVIPDNETISRGNGAYNIATFIKYYQDPYDGVDPPADPIFDDYKIATIKISWQGRYGAKEVTNFSKIIPRTEETSSGNGLLKIIVVDANANPVEDATIHVENSTHSMSATSTSDINGEFRYSVPPDFEGYEITVTKTGYGVDRTYPRTMENPNPTKPHLTVQEGIKTEESFSIDLLGSLNIRTITQVLPSNWQANTDLSLEAQSNARIAFDSSGYIYIVWEDYRDTSDSKLYAQKYNSSGSQQWLPGDIRISTANNQVLPDILVDSTGSLYICWNDDSNGNQDAYIDKRLSANGDPDPAWGGELKLSVLAQNNDQINARIALTEITSTILSVVWQDNRNADLDVYLQRYDTNKTAQLSPELRLSATVLDDGTNQYGPAIITDSDENIYVVWTDDRNGNLDIYGTKLASTTDFIWEELLNTDGGSTDQYSPDIAIDNSDYIYIVWTDERNGDQDIYAQKYDSSGNSVWTNDVKINTDSLSVSQSEPALAIDSSNILYIVWTDERNGDQDIYAQKYDSSGYAIWPEDMRISISTTTSAEYNPDVTINPIDDKPFATWQSDVNGNLDIFITSFDYTSASSSVANVPITVVGTKRIGENPIIYEYDQEFITDADGYANLVVEWDIPGYTIDLKTASTSYTLILSIPSQPIELLPASATNVFLLLD